MARTTLNAIDSRDRRRFDRLIPRYLRTYSPEPARIIDLSRRGMCLEATVRLIPGSLCAFRIRRQGCIVHLTGQMRWQGIRSVIDVPDGDTLEIYRSGVAFADEMSQEMLAFLLDLHQRPAGQRSHPINESSIIAPG